MHCHLTVNILKIVKKWGKTLKNEGKPTIFKNLVSLEHKQYRRHSR